MSLQYRWSHERGHYGTVVVSNVIDGVVVATVGPIHREEGEDVDAFTERVEAMVAPRSEDAVSTEALTAGEIIANLHAALKQTTESRDACQSENTRLVLENRELRAALAHRLAADAAAALTHPVNLEAQS